jgi:hypothetical protein
MPLRLPRGLALSSEVIPAVGEPWLQFEAMDRVWDVFLEGVLPIGAFVLVVTSVLVVIRVRAGGSLRDVGYVSILDALLIGWAVGLSLVTLGDWFGEGRQLDLMPMRSIWRYLEQWDETTVPATQILGNVLLFFPFGLLAPARWPRFRRPLATLAAGAIIGFVIEVLQFITAQGRVASTDDLILAIVGIAAGWLVFRAVAAIAGQIPTGRTPSRASPGSPRS